MTTHSHQQPKQSKELQILNYLYSRVNLSSIYKRKLDNLYKGYVGDKTFYHLLQNKQSNNYLMLYDLLLESNNVDFQIDCLLISANSLYLFEIKNFEGDFLIQDEKWYIVSTKKEIRSPLLQLNRSEFLLRHLIKEIGLNFKIKPYVVFVNKEFTLYQLPLDLPITLPTQLPRLIKKLNNKTSTITNHHTKLSNQLIAKHKEDIAYQRLPDYNFKQMKMGIPCITCRKFLSQYNNRKLICKKCGKRESIESAVLRNVVEFTILFPGEKVTLSLIHEWCAFITSKKVIRRILMKYLELSPQGRNSHYNFPAIQN